jgi:hypothetical protein
MKRLKLFSKTKFNFVNKAISLLSATGFDFSSSNKRVSKILNPQDICPKLFDHVLNKIFSQIHIVIQIIESHFWLNHPKCKVTYLSSLL